MDRFAPIVSDSVFTTSILFVRSVNAGVIQTEPMTHIASENPYSASKVNGLSDEHRNSSRFKRVCAVLICVHLVLMLIFVSAIVGCSLAYVPNMPAQQLQDSILRRLVIFGLLLFGVHLFAIFLLIEFRKQSMRIQHFTDRQT